MNAFFSMMAMPLAACVLLFLILNYMGIHVLMREIIFIDITLAQVSVVGALISMLLFGHNPVIGEISAFAFCLAAAAFFSAARKKETGISMETVIGVSYAVAAAAALFLLYRSPEGHSRAREMFDGSILWTTSSDVVKSFWVFLICAVLFWIFRDRFLENSMKYAEDSPGDFWGDFLFYSLFAAVITLSAKMGGVLLVFAFLVLPAVTASLFTESIHKKVLFSWLVSLIASAGGLIFSYKMDFSVGPSIVASLGIILIAASLYARFFRRLSR